MIQLPDELFGGSETNNLQDLINTDGHISEQMGMLAQRLDLNTSQRILINDGTNDRILIGYNAGAF